MTSKLYIITGSSRGLGRALVERLLVPGHHVIAIARSAGEPLPVPAGATLETWLHDLAAPAEAAARLDSWLAAQAPDRWAEAALVNNAALLVAPGPLDDVAPDDVAAALRVGLEAPVLLSAAFLRATGPWHGVRKLLQISSGLGRRAMAGSAVYCATKAGLDHFARSLALDEALQPNGCRVCSLAPGVIDTGMQQQLRSADPRRFAEHQRFADLARTGALDSPAAAAARIADVLARADFGAEPVADVRTARA